VEALLAAAAAPAAAPLPPPAEDLVPDPTLLDLVPADLPRLLALLPGADLYLQDEVEVALHPTLTRVWGRRGRRGQRRVETPGTNATQYGFGLVDWPFDELAEWATRGTVADTFGYYRGEAGTNPFASGPYLRQWGAEPVDATGKKATFMDQREAFIQALTFRSNLTNVWKVSPNPRDGAIAQERLFGAEQRVLALDIWPNRMQAYLRDFRDFEMDFVLTPTVKRGDRRRSMLNEHVFGVTTASKAPEEAFSFLSWIAGKEMNVRGMLEGGKGPIARADVWADTRITDRWPAYKKLGPLMDGIEADYLVANFRGEEFDAAYSTAYTKMERGEAPVLETASEIQRLTQAVLDREPA
jgi:ABC-type glycerol-3-phosphate transport system substrate-binding protein